jgi:hypothetical protein
VRAHSTSSSTSTLSSEFFPAMSSLGGSAVGGEGILEKRGPGRPKGSGKKIEAPELTPPASRKRGRPKGSRNQKTLAALAVAAAPITTATAGAAPALCGEGVPKKRAPGCTRGSGRKTAPTAAAAPSLPRRRGRPPGSKNTRTLAPLGAAASNSTSPRAATSPPAGPSRLRPEKPALQPPAYILAEGWSTCIVPILAGAKDLLRLCRGDDFWGTPRAVLSAGRHPRNLQGAKSRRPALIKGPAAPAAGWQLHRGEPEPSEDDKTPPTAASPKVAWPRQDRQR